MVATRHGLSDKPKLSLSHPVICVVGPTASGKSGLAIRLACALNGEVVSADSMQVYRGMDIGTGKVSEPERMVPHYGLDLVDPGEPYSAALFQDYARGRFRAIDARGKRVILCGGTGFYIRAAIDDYEFPAGEQKGNAIRDAYNAIAEQRGAHELWLLLKDRDAASAALIPENDVKRVVRAFELLEEGTSYAAQKEALAGIGQAVDAVFIGLSVEPQLLRERIERRVDEMFEMGLVDEVSALLEAGFRQAITAQQAIGYKEVVQALDGLLTLDEARDSIKVATRRYAKRQRTWFRKDKRIAWIDANGDDGDALLEEALDVISRRDS